MSTGFSISELGVNGLNKLENGFSLVCNKINEFANRMEPYLPAIIQITDAAAMILQITFPEFPVEGIYLGIKAAGTLVTEVARLVADDPCNIDTAELGFRIANCDRKPDDFESYDAYIKYVSGMNIDLTELKNSKQFDEIGYHLVGIDARIKQINEATNMKLVIGNIIQLAKARFNPSEVKTLIVTAKENNLSELPELDGYFREDISSEQSEEIDNLFSQALGDAADIRMFEAQNEYLSDYKKDDGK